MADDQFSWHRILHTGDVANQILRTAQQQDADLIVMSTAGPDGVLDALRGSTTEQVLRRAPCPLLATPV